MTWGEKLKEAREKRGYTIDDVEEETKIRKFYLEALEKEDFASLPPKIYAVGFVKRYARLLNLDEKKIADEFQLMAYGRESRENRENNFEKIENQFGVNNIKLKNVLAGLLFLAIVLWLGNFLLSYVLDWQITDLLPDKTPIVEAPVKNNETEVKNQTEGNIGKTPNLSVLAKERCWLLVKADGKEIFQGTLEAGDEKTFEFKGNEHVYLKAGNAGGLELSLNGKEMDKLGKQWEVKEIEFFLGAEDSQ